MKSSCKQVKIYKNIIIKIKLLQTVCLFIILQSCSDIKDTYSFSNDKETESFGIRAKQATPSDYVYSNKKTFKVLSWNVEHFVDEYDDPYIDAKREDNPTPEIKKKIDGLVEVLKKENADMVVLQEFESSKFLRKIAENHLEGMGYKFFASAPSDGWYMNVVVMSKLPLGVMYAYGNVTTPVVNYTNEEGLSETQNNLNTRMWTLEVFPSEDYNFILTGLHLKAGRGDRNESMRLGQINFLKNQFSRFIKMNASQNLLIAGDLNSTLGSKEIETLKHGEDEAKKFYDPLPENILTHPSDNPTRRLDYMLFNGNMKKEYIQDSASIPGLLEDEKMRTLSDHLPLVVEFQKNDQ